MTKVLAVGKLATFLLLIGCGDGSSGEGGGGSGGSEETTTTGSTKAATGPATSSSTSSTSSSSTTGGTTVATTAATTGAGGGAEHCADAVRCDGVRGYFCYEVSGPDAAFEQACAEELFGTYAEGPCGPEYDTSACLFDCEEPSVFSIAITIDQAECEGEGGTWVENP
jgi:hypothetical protein